MRWHGPCSESQEPLPAADSAALALLQAGTEGRSLVLLETACAARSRLAWSSPTTHHLHQKSDETRELTWD